MAVPSVVIEGCAAGQRLEGGQPESLFERRAGDHGGPAQQRRHGGIGEVPGADDAITVPGRGQGALGLLEAPAGLAAQDEHARQRVASATRSKARHQGHHALAGFQRADEGHQRALGRDAGRLEGLRIRARLGFGRPEALVVDAVRRHDDGARTAHEARSRSAVTSLTQISAPARAAARRMARRKKTAFERRCHSG